MNKTPGWLLALTTVLLLNMLGLSLVESLRLLLALTIVALFGARLVRQLGFPAIAPAVGWLLGLSLQVFGSQALVLAGLSAELSHLAVLTTLSVYVITSRLLTNDQATKSPNLTTLRFSLAVCLLASAIRHLWLLPFVTCCVLGWVILSRQKQLGLAYWANVGALLFGTIVSLKVRPEWWFLQNNNDGPFFESLSWSIAHWSVFEHPGFAGGSIAGYHWFAYGLLGTISILGDLKPWEGMLQLLPVGMLAATATMVREFSWRGDSDDKVFMDTQSVAVATAATLLYSGPFPDSYSFSLIVALAFLAVAREVSARLVSLHKSIVVCFMMSTILVLSKVSTAAVLVGVLSVSSLLKTRTRSKENWALPLIVLVLSLASFIILGRPSDTQGANILYVTKFSANLTYTLEALRALLARPEVFLTIAALLVVLAVGRRQNGNRASSDILYLSIILITPIGLASFLVIDTSTIGYFGRPPLEILGLISVWRLDSLLRHRKTRILRNELIGMLLVVGSATLFALGYRQLTWWLDNEVVALEVFPKNFLIFIFTPLPIAILTTVATVYLKNHSTQNSRVERLFVSFVLACVGFLAGHTSFTKVESLRRGLTYFTDGSEAAYPADDLTVLGAYIRNNTEFDTILASNNFCCSESDKAFYENGYGGANYLLPAVTQRRFLIQGPRFQGSHRPDFPYPELVERVRLTLEFANRPNATVVAALRDRGVDGFIVNLELTEHRDWSSYARERFRSGKFVYFTLDTD